MKLEDVKKLSDEDLKAVVAKMLGWKWHEFYENSACWIRKDGAQMWSEGCPDYPNDLNAMHEAVVFAKEHAWERGETPEDFMERYSEILEQVVRGWEIEATARQRAEAFVVTMESKA